MKFRENVIRFMGGRYGNDQLGTAIFAVCMVLLLINIFIRSAVISLIVLAAMIWSIYRSMSRKIYDRQRENSRFLYLMNRVKSFFSIQKRRFADRKTHAYRTCPGCGKTLRLPRQKGSHTVCCPNCHKDFSCRIH